MMKLRLPLTLKLTLVFVIFAAVVLTLVSVLAYISGRSALQDATISDLLSTALEKQAALEVWFGERQSDMAILAAWPALLGDTATFIAAAENSPTALEAHERVLALLKPRAGPGFTFLTLSVLEPEFGKVMISTDPHEEGKSKAERSFFIYGKHGSYTQNVYDSLELDPAIILSTPLRSADGRLLGVLTGEVNLAELNSIMNRRTGMRRTIDAYLVNSANLLVTQPRFISDPMRQHVISTESVQRCLTRDNGIVDTEDYMDQHAIAVYRWLPERELCLIVKIDQAEAFAPSRAFGETIIAVNGFALLAAFILAIVLARTISRPVLTLQAGAERFGRGELGVRLPENSQDELGLLGHALNQMAIGLAEKETQLREHTKQLEMANQELEAFSYSVSHDLRAPLRAIDGFARILSEDHAAQLSPEAQRYLTLVRANTHHMGHLIDDLLTFSRLGRQPLHKQTVTPAMLIRQSLENLRAEQEGRKIEIVIGELPNCQADPALLTQVWLNLLSNAIKFTRKREKAVIEIGGEEKANQRIYFVKDNGVGFDMQYANKLFGVFQRLHRTEEFEGTGVGLAIVQRVVLRHGGRVWAEGEVGKGAVFYFSLPWDKRPEPTSSGEKVSK